MQITPFQCHIILSIVACRAPLHICTLPHEWHYFLKKFIEHKIFIFKAIHPHCVNTVNQRYRTFTCVYSESAIPLAQCAFWFSLQILFETFLNLRIQGDTTINVHSSSHKKLSHFNENELSNFLKIPKYQTSWKSIQWELNCSMQRDRQTWQS